MRFAVLVALLAAAACGGADPVPPATGPIAEPTVILVSLDGFRWDYQQLTDTPHLDALAARGVQADGLIPSFPSKTFPSHYTVVTGLYPANHGIVSNNMRDPGWAGEFHLGTEELTKGRWWGGEPIWTTANKHGMVTASFFWPGSDVVINGDRPRYFFPYDGGIPFEDRVDQVLEWLQLPDGERPQFITLYFADPNDTSHEVGPEHPDALAAVRRVDDMIGRLVDGLEAAGRLATTDIVVTADHGMALMSPERVIPLGDYFDFEPAEVFESGSFVQIFPGTGRAEAILEALQDAHPNFAVYHRDATPERYHLRGSTRVAPIVGIPDIGWSARYGTADTWDRDRLLLGDHGGDPRHPDMAGIFIAAGPHFAEGARVPAFENVQIYNLLAAALGIEPAPNDGDLRRVPGILR